MAAAAVAAVVALSGLWAASLSGDLDETRATLKREHAAAAVRLYADARTVALQEGQGRLVVGFDGKAVLVLDGVDPAPAGQTYEMDSSRAVPPPGELFPGRDGTDVVLLDGRVDVGDVVAVTVEEEGGVDAPTTEPIAASQPV